MNSAKEMFYSFPWITHLSDVLPHIEGRPEFIVAKKEHFTVVNYVVMNADTFSREHPGWEVRRELRGIKFCADTGKILQRPLHKFFNLNEKDEVRHENVNFTSPHRIVDKVDGSMLVPILIGDHVRWTTKMGITSVALEAEKYVVGIPGLTAWVKNSLREGYTPIFEFTSPACRIVVDYGDKPNITLLAIRKTVSGDYLDSWSVPAPSGVSWVANFDHPELDVDKIKILGDREGVVVDFANGHKIKVKSDWYVALHKTKDAINREHNLVALILGSLLDDAKPNMDAPTREKVEKFEEDFQKELRKVFYSLESDLNAVFFLYPGLCYGRPLPEDRKRFALEVEPSLHKQWIFRVIDGGDPAEVIRLAAVKACNRESTWEEFKKNAKINLEWKGVLWS